jgi:hypothetical protein
VKPARPSQGLFKRRKHEPTISRPVIFIEILTTHLPATPPLGRQRLKDNYLLCSDIIPCRKRSVSARELNISIEHMQASKYPRGRRLVYQVGGELLVVELRGGIGTLS